MTLLQIVSGPETTSHSDISGFERVCSIEHVSKYTPLLILRGLLGPLPVTLLKYSSTDVCRRLTELVLERGFDTIQVESVHLMPYVNAIRGIPGNPVVFGDWHNIESELMSRYASTARNPAKKLAARRTANLIERAEDRFLALCDRHLVVSERERDVLLHRSPTARIDVIPNGVDVRSFDGAAPRGSEGKSTLLFVGSMDYHANIDAVMWFAQSVWPGISRKHPGLRFFIVGRNPPEAVRALACDSILVTGSVADVKPFYRDAVATVVPLRVGGGTRLKILEAMAAGVPVVSTSLGAEGIEAEPGKHLIIADTGEQLSSALTHLLSDAGLQNEIACAGRALVASKYDWNLLGDELFALHRRALRPCQRSESES